MAGGLTNEDFRKLVQSSATSKSELEKEGDGEQRHRHYHHHHHRSSSHREHRSGHRDRHRDSSSKKSLSSQSSSFADSSKPKKEPKPRYRDRASERRQHLDSGEDETSIGLPQLKSSTGDHEKPKGLDFALLRRAKQGEDVLSELVPDVASYGGGRRKREEEEGGDDAELDMALDRILEGGELERHEVEGAREGSRSKTELLAELRRRVAEKPKPKFKPIGKNTAEEEEEEERRRREKEREREKERRRKMRWDRRSPAPTAEQIQQKIEEEKGVSDRTPIITPETTPKVTAKVGSVETERESVEVTERERVEITERKSEPLKSAYVVLDAGKKKKEDILAAKNDEDDDDLGSDIFSDVGTDYNPLSDDGDKSSDDEEDDKSSTKALTVPKTSPFKRTRTSEEADERPAKKHDYFAFSSKPPAERSTTPTTTTATTHTTTSTTHPSTQMMDLIQTADLTAMAKNVRAQKEESKRQGLVPLQAMGGDYDIDDDLGGEGRWIEDDEEDFIGKKGPKGKGGKKRKR